MKQSCVDRRSLLLGSIAGAAVSFADTRPASAAADASKSLPGIRVAEDRITRKIAGLRPFRPSGFVVGMDGIGDKTLLHNYGHGGFGVAFSWGAPAIGGGNPPATPHLPHLPVGSGARLALQTSYRQAAVIGCGAIGLATARLLQDRGFDVAIYAKEVPPNTTSNIAAALFGVTSLVDDAHHTGEIVGRIQQAARFAHRYFQNFIGERYGVRWVDFSA